MTSLIARRIGLGFLVDSLVHVYKDVWSSLDSVLIVRWLYLLSEGSVRL